MRRSKTGSKTSSDSKAASHTRDEKSLAQLRQEAKSCRACDLYKHATQTVFGAGNEHARIIFVGEQPGDYEDRAGEPFVGPAGRLLDKAMAEAGIERTAVYFTNAVKHFKFIERGKRRIHKQPRVYEIKACQPWLLSEIDLIKPTVVVCLGATAAKSLLKEKASVTKDRGKFVHAEFAPFVVQTLHPSAILRQPDSRHRHQAYDQLVFDLKAVAKVVRQNTSHK